MWVNEKYLHCNRVIPNCTFCIPIGSTQASALLPPASLWVQTSELNLSRYRPRRLAGITSSAEDKKAAECSLLVIAALVDYEHGNLSYPC